MVGCCLPSDWKLPTDFRSGNRSITAREKAVRSRMAQTMAKPRAQWQVSRQGGRRSAIREIGERRLPSPALGIRQWGTVCAVTISEAAALPFCVYR